MPKVKCKQPCEEYDEGSHVMKRCTNMCIIHVDGIVSSKFTHIKDLPDPEGKFQQLCDIRDK
jgi:hypothetical protein